jgi:NIMA (never in mitosis gene a)-related kinase
MLGILCIFIMMEYCGCCYLPEIIKQAQKQKRVIPEDAIWNSFMQILLALHYRRHPNGMAGLALGLELKVGKGRRNVLRSCIGI